MDKILHEFHNDPKFNALVEMLAAHLEKNSFSTEEFLKAIYIANVLAWQRREKRQHI